MATADVEYRKTGTFNEAVFMAAYTEQFKNIPRYNAASIPDLIKMVAMMERDPAMLDMRWMAYLLATAFVESSSTIKITRRSTNNKGHVVPRQMTVWRNFSPVEEKGHGRHRKYQQPVKVKLLANGSVRVTEYDGDQWLVHASGAVPTPLKHGATRGTDYHVGPTATYRQDDGEEQYYFGRGYCQLTWWNNYAAAGFMVGRGLDLLLEPDAVEEPELAYKIISVGMLTGGGFANGHTFREYFHGGHTDYVHARHMVNGRSHAHDIAGFAEHFERALRAASTPSKAVVSG